MGIKKTLGQIVKHPIDSAFYWGFGDDIADAGKRTREKMIKEAQAETESEKQDLERRLGKHHAFQIWRTFYLRWTATMYDATILINGTYDGVETSLENWWYHAGWLHTVEFTFVQLQKRYGIKDKTLSALSSLDTKLREKSKTYARLSEWVDIAAGAFHLIYPLSHRIRPIFDKYRDTQTGLHLPKQKLTPRQAYERLGLPKDTSDDEIKTTYRQIAMDTHPDRHPDDKEKEEEFKKIAEAYEVLKEHRGF